MPNKCYIPTANLLAHESKCRKTGKCKHPDGRIGKLFFTNSNV